MKPLVSPQDISAEFSIFLTTLKGHTKEAESDSLTDRQVDLIHRKLIRTLVYPYHKDSKETLVGFIDFAHSSVKSCPYGAEKNPVVIDMIEKLRSTLTEVYERRFEYDPEQLVQIVEDARAHVLEYVDEVLLEKVVAMYEKAEVAIEGILAMQLTQGVFDPR